ncbi:MAG: transcriptional regulator [Actinomycetota bacterium]|nr:transcriptional regulator [Actinomycetota bacterium]
MSQIGRDGVGSHVSTPDLLVVQAVRVKGFAQAAAVAAATGLEAGDIEVLLSGLADAGHARHREGRMSGWMLTPEGRVYGEALLAAELETTGARSAVERAYRDFLEANQGFLGLCTDWQLRPNPDAPNGDLIVNDHTDTAHDAAVVARLGDADKVVRGVCNDLAGVLARFDGYGERFAEALARVRAGEVEWFTRPLIDSYHTVWFELHENLLATLGIERVREQAG